MMNDTHLYEIARLLLAALLGAFINHWLVLHRAKKDDQRRYSKEKLHSFYAPLLIQSDLLKSEIDAWNKLLEPNDNEKDTPNFMELKRKVLLHHFSNMIDIKENIIKLISKNYGLINECDEKWILAFLESLQTKVSLMKLDGSNLILIDNEMKEIHPLDFLLKSIELLHKDLESTISNLKSEIQP